MKHIYFDYNATTPVDPEVFEAMKPYYLQLFGNASSFHQKGQASRNAVDKAREIIGNELGVEPGDVFFTSGGTESDNLALKGVMEARAAQNRKHLIVSSIEHQAVLHTAKTLEKRGYRVSYVPVNAEGIVRLEMLEKMVDEETALVSIMHVNNEVGTVQPVAEAAHIAHAKGAWFHTDAVQSFGKLSVLPDEWGADLISLSAHKICGPKGIGGLYVKKGIKLKAQTHGGHQEKNIRPGTENVAAIVGFGKAVQVCSDIRAKESAKVGALRDKLEKGLADKAGKTHLNGDPYHRIYNTLNLSFDGLDGETLLMNLDLKNICVSTGSACTAGSVEPSHVLTALGLTGKRARSAIRFSLGRFTTEHEIEEALEIIPPIIARLRRSSTGS